MPRRRSAFARVARRAPSRVARARRASRDARARVDRALFARVASRVARRGASTGGARAAGKAREERARGRSGVVLKHPEVLSTRTPEMRITRQRWRTARAVSV